MDHLRSNDTDQGMQNSFSNHDISHGDINVRKFQGDM